MCIEWMILMSIGHCHVQIHLEENQKLLFTRFRRLKRKEHNRVKGIGLGLFIVTSVAQKHGGRVFAESEGPGHGSTFTLQLPLAPSA